MNTILAHQPRRAYAPAAPRRDDALALELATFHAHHEAYRTAIGFTVGATLWVLSAVGLVALAVLVGAS